MYTLKQLTNLPCDFNVTQVGCRQFIVVVGVSALLSGCGTIGSDPDFESGLYVGAGVGVSRLEPDTSQNSIYSVDDSNSAGGQFAVGYDLTSRVSIEGHIAELGEATLNPSGAIDYQEYGLSALYYGLNDRYDRNERVGFSGYGRLGIGVMENDAGNVPFNQVNQASLLAGVGLEYGFDFGLALRGEIIAFDKDAQYAQLGLVYRFGDREINPRDDRGTAPSGNSPVTAPSVNSESVPIIVDGPADGDFDGVFDDADQCPSTPAGRPVDSKGCELFNGALEGVNFETGSDRLTAEARAVLEDAAITLQGKPDIRVVIEAHTDNQGSAVSNLELSKRRALAVARFLVDRGIAPNRLQPQAYGESKPRTSNATAEGRKMNRRVEFKVLD